MNGPMTGAMLKHVRDTLKLSAAEMAALKIGRAHV